MTKIKSAQKRSHLGVGTQGTHCIAGARSCAHGAVAGKSAVYRSMLRHSGRGIYKPRLCPGNRQPDLRHRRQDNIHLGRNRQSQGRGAGRARH